MRQLLPAILLALGACSGEHAAHWSYEGDTGPAHWANLDPAHVLARTGQRQYPIDIKTTALEAQENAGMQLHYQPATLDIINNGHTVEDRFTDGGYIELEGTRYELAQFHVHLPSEHTIDGKPAAAELHLVHRSNDGQLAVVAVMIHEGAEHAEFHRIGTYLPSDIGRANHVDGVQVNPNEFLPDDLSSYRYSGSLTTPPCTEDVSWVVLKTPIEVSAEQIGRFRTLYSGNNRPVQPLFDRNVQLHR